MFEIISKRQLNTSVEELDIYAPLVAKKAQAGQFIILRTDSEGERIPLTIAGFNREKGSVKIIYQIVGATTLKLSLLKVGECLADFTGPLGNPSELSGLQDVIVMGGGVGCAIALPIAAELHRRGARVRSVIGFRSKDLVILENEFQKVSDELYVTTDDGSYGEHGVITLPLERMLSGNDVCERIYAIGPVPMMKFSYLTAAKYNIPVTVSMNPIMIDGTGMCGGCRLSVKGKMSFACVDGPEYEACDIDFDELAARNRMYREFERHAYVNGCNLLKKGDNKNV